MKIVNIKKSLLEMDKATDCKYDLTTLYESCNLDEKKKKELVKYVDAFDIDATNRFLSNEASNQGLMEEVADDLTDEEVSKMLGESNETRMKTNSKTLCESVIHMTDETHANPLVTGQTLEVGDLVYDDNGNKLKVISVEENSKYSRNISFVNVDTNETSSEIVGNNTYWEKVVDGDIAYEVDDDIQIEFHPIDELTTQLEALDDCCVEYTADELKDKFGTDNVELINAGKEANKRVKVKEAVPAAAMALASSAATGFGQAVGDKLTSKILGEDLDNTSIEKEVRDAMYAFLEPKYDTEFVNDYCGVQVEDTEDNVIVRVNAELGYEGLSSLGDYLNKTIVKFDPQSYFEPETTGRLVAYIRKDQSDDIVDEEAFKYWSDKFNACKTKDEVIDLYQSLVEVRERGSVTYGTISALYDIVDAKLKEFPQDRKENEIDFDSEVTFNESLTEDVNNTDEDEISEIEQEFTSQNTSINSTKLPAIFKLVKFEPNTINLDYGGGKFDNAAEYLKEFDVTNLVYDPYNRTSAHNSEVIKTIKQNGGADSATCSNVLNVVKEENVRINILNNIKKLVKPNGKVYITVYEGSGSGDGTPTKAGYQMNRKTDGYLEEIKSVFPDATRRGKLITATNSNSSKLTEAIDTNWDEEISNCKTIEDVKSLLKKIAVNYECGNITEEKVYQLYNSLDDKLNDIDTPVHYVADLLDEVESELDESLSDDDLDYYFTDDNIEYVDDDFTDDELASILGGDRNYCPECGSNMYSDGHCYKCGDPEEINESLNEDINKVVPGTLYKVCIEGKDEFLLTTEFNDIQNYINDQNIEDFKATIFTLSNFKSNTTPYLEYNGGTYNNLVYPDVSAKTVIYKGGKCLTNLDTTEFKTPSISKVEDYVVRLNNNIKQAYNDGVIVSPAKEQFKYGVKVDDVIHLFNAESDALDYVNEYPKTRTLTTLNENSEQPEKYIKLDLMEPDYNYFTIGGKEVPYKSHEEAKEHLDDFKFSDYEKELYEFLKSNNMYNEIYVQPDNTLCIKVEYGDWKHDHAYLDKLVHNFFFNKGLIVESEKEVTEESDSDCFSADHFYRIVDVVFSMSLKPVNESVGTYAIVGWLSDHEQAYDDAVRHFGGDLDKVKEADLVGWISDHDQLYADYKNYFKLNESVEADNLNSAELSAAEYALDLIANRPDMDVDAAIDEGCSIYNYAYLDYPEEDAANFPEVDSSKVRAYVKSKLNIHESVIDVNEALNDYRFEVSCNDGPSKVISTVADNEDKAIKYVKNMYAQEHTTYADDRANKWTIRNLNESKSIKEGK